MERYVIILLALISTNIFAGPPDAAMDEAIQEFVKAIKAEETFKNNIIQYSKNMPLTHRASFIEMATEHVSIENIIGVHKQALPRYFTLEEIKAMTKFYHDPVIQKAMTKMPSYMSEVMPNIQKEVKAAQERFHELKAQEFNEKYKIKK